MTGVLVPVLDRSVFSFDGRPAEAKIFSAYAAIQTTEKSGLWGAGGLGATYATVEGKWFS